MKSFFILLFRMTTATSCHFTPTEGLNTELNKEKTDFAIYNEVKLKHSFGGFQGKL